MGRGANNSNGSAVASRTLNRSNSSDQVKQAAKLLEGYLDDKDSVDKWDAADARDLLEGHRSELEITYWGTRGQSAQIEGAIRTSARELDLQVTDIIQTKKGWVQQAYTAYIAGNMKDLVVFKSWWKEMAKQMENPH